jgi:hypothetical protein
LRSRFRHLVSEEKHDGVELTVNGRRHSRDLTWMAEEMADDGKTWGKTTAMTRGLAMWNESWNGMAKWRLANGQWAVACHLGIGEKLQGAERFLPADRFYSQRRGRSEWQAHTSVTGCRCHAGVAAQSACGQSPTLGWYARLAVGVQTPTQATVQLYWAQFT